ncbi:MAG: hypothetical protein JWP49_276 [Phenylobacterium sp.]|nr:hypothetical protein [Phenylobacterium sp.]
MIRYALICEHGHEFEGWFGASADFDTQAANGQLQCPLCATQAVTKQIMAPAVAGAKRTVQDEGAPKAQMMMEAMGRLRRHVEANFDDVGDAFAKEARAIHEGRAEDRGIYGQASPKQVRELVEDGVPVAPLPPKPPEPSELN